MIGHLARERARPKRSVLTAGLIFLTLQASLATVVEYRLPSLRDPEFGAKLTRLRQRIAEEPGQPLVLVLGSSRAGCGLRPDVVAADTSYRGDRPLVFNFAIAGAGPLIELMMLHRLHQLGILPKCVIVEVMPMLLHQQEPWAEATRFPIHRVASADFGLLRKMWSDPGTQELAWWTASLVPWHTHRFGILNRIEPRWLGWGVRQDHWNRLDDYGWLPDPRETVPAAEYERGLLAARRDYAPCSIDFRITANAASALDELLELCRAIQTEAILVTMPESRAFRGEYSAGALEEIKGFLCATSEAHGIPWIDARDWMPDNAFGDGHHLLATGARAFSQRLALALSEMSASQTAAGGTWR